MEIIYWGTRGSIPSPGRDTVVYGGNTPCVEVRLKDKTEIIIDAGSGIRKLGDKLLKEKIKEIHLFITHSHWDHIQGFPFFVPAYIKGYKIHIYGASPTFGRLIKVLSGQMKFLYFPVEFHNLASAIDYRKINKGGIDIGGIHITVIRTNHPLETHAFKFQEGNKTFVFMTDNELDSQDIATIPIKEHLKFVEGADILVHDAQYLKKEIPLHKNWGHSSWESAVAFANKAGVKNLYLFHHDPNRTDKEINLIVKKAKERSKKTKVFGAKEGKSLIL